MIGNLTVDRQRTVIGHLHGGPVSAKSEKGGSEWWVDDSITESVLTVRRKGSNERVDEGGGGGG